MRTWIGARLRRARLDQGLAQGALAEKLGVAQATISNWETGKGKPQVSEITKLEKVLGKFNAPPASAKSGGGNAFVPATRAFSDWLRKARQAAKMSVYELAEASGVSQVQIYNLEAGRSANPRDSTKERLEKSLKVKVPKDVQDEVAEEQEIKGLGPLTDFDPHDVADRPSSPGVYVFYDVSDRPVYVGKSRNINVRVKLHGDKFWFKYPIVSHAAYIEIKDENLRHQVEQVLIKFLKSNAVINSQSVERD